MNIKVKKINEDTLDELAHPIVNILFEMNSYLKELKEKGADEDINREKIDAFFNLIPAVWNMAKSGKIKLFAFYEDSSHKK